MEPSNTWIESNTTTGRIVNINDRINFDDFSLQGDLPTWLFIDYFGFSAYPAGLLRMSARTLSVYLRMFLNNGSDILRPRSIAEMRTVVGGGLMLHYQDSNSNLTEPLPSTFGLSWYWRTMSNGRRYIGHSGSLPGMVHLMLVDEKHSVGVIVLSNGDTNPPNDLSREISETLAEIHVALFQCFETDAVNASTTTSVSQCHSINIYYDVFCSRRYQPMHHRHRQLPDRLVKKVITHPSNRPNS
jgi:CubicO group peptidase (beta-lactamase class C family)